MTAPQQTYEISGWRKVSLEYMDQQWRSYEASNMNHPARFGTGLHSAPLQAGRDTSGQTQQHHSFNYDSFQPTSSNSNGLSMSSTPSATSHSRDYNGDTDVPMEDADPYNRSKYPSRPTHQHRSSTQYLGHEGSSAAQRYSPMNALSPTVPYPSSPKSFSYQNQTPGSRQSPTRQSYFPNSSQHYHESPSKYYMLSSSLVSSIHKHISSQF